MLRTFLTAAITLVFGMIELLSQMPPTIAFEHYGIEHGLSQGSALCIHQDRKGFLWIGTEDGLNRYDGYSFVVYRHKPQDSSTISSNLVYAIHEDKDGMLWLGTGRGLCRFNPATDRFTSYPRTSNNPQGLPTKPVFAIYSDSENILWLSTLGAGLCRFDPITHHCFQYLATQDSAGLRSNNVYGIVSDKMGRLWAATEKGICTVQRAPGYHSDSNSVNVRIRNFYHDSTVPLPIRSSILRSVFADREGIIWMGVAGGGVFTYNQAQNLWQEYRTPLKARIGNSSEALKYEVRAMHQDPATGAIWFATKQGLFRRDVANRDAASDTLSYYLSYYKNNARDSHSLSGNSLTSLYTDRAGVLWVGTGGLGLNAYNPNAKLFRNTKHDPSSASSLSDNIVRGMLEDAAGRLWVATADGLCQYNPATAKWTTFRSDSTNTHTLSDNDIRSLAIDQKGVLWIGTFTGGLCSYDESQGSKRGIFRRYPFNPKDSSGFPTKTVFKIYIDRSGTVWFGTLGEGLYSYSPESKRFLHHEEFNSLNKRWYGLGTVRAITEDRSGNLWIGTAGSGLFRYSHRTNGAFQSFTHTTQIPNSLSSNIIFSIYEDKHCTLWIGTDGGGLNRFDATTGTFTAWNESEGLPNGVVYGIVEDDRGFLWLSTNKGLSKFDPVTYRFRNYDITDGLPSNEFNKGAYYRLRDGSMMFGGMAGYTQFVPEHIKDNRYVPPVVITNFKKFNKNVVLDSSIAFIRTLEITHLDLVVSFEFAGLSFINSEKNRYAYKLEGFNDNWIEIGVQRTVNFTSLPPGKYVFRVKACNNDGLWNEQGTSVELIVLPPWWRTRWFYALITVLIASSLGGAYYSRVHFVERQNRKLKELVRQQTQELKASLEEIASVNEEMLRQNTILEVQARDIELANTELHQMNHQLEQQNEQLAWLNNEKSEFLGIAAHDMKNPLTSIILSTENLRRYGQRLTSEQIEASYRNILETAGRMKNIMENLLDSNAIESGTINLVIESFDVTALASMVIAEYEAIAAKKHIHLEFATVPTQAVLVFADRAITQEILDNLISNAIKYSPHHTTTRIYVESRSDSACIIVKDEGPGFTEDDKKRLFGKFARLSARPTGGEHSTGLGLSIVKKMAEAMNGRVWCESELGKGATFFVELPKVLPKVLP